jgi:hypothetical protein
MEHKFNEYSRRARAEGHRFEDEFLALVKEMHMASFNEVLGQLNSLKDRFSQVEADVQDLVKKAGTTQSGGVGVGVPQEQIDAAAAVVQNLGERMDALVSHVVSGAPVDPASVPPTSSTDSVPMGDLFSATPTPSSGTSPKP